MNNNDNCEAGERNGHSPVLQNKLPPGYGGNRSKKMPSRKLGRKKSRNLMTSVGSPPKQANSGRDKYPNLPTESQKRIDYVIVYENKSVDEVTGNKEQRKLKKKLELREKFLKSLAYDDIEVKEDVIGDHVFMQLHVPFHRLCEQAEKIKLELPLKGVRWLFHYWQPSACVILNDCFIKIHLIYKLVHILQTSCILYCIYGIFLINSCLSVPWSLLALHYCYLYNLVSLLIFVYNF